MLVRNWSTIISRLSNKSLHDHVLSMDIDKKLWKLVNTISNSRRLSIIGNYWVSGKSRFPNVCCHKLVGSSMRLCCSNGEGGKTSPKYFSASLPAQFLLFITFHNLRILPPTMNGWQKKLCCKESVWFVFTFRFRSSGWGGGGRGRGHYISCCDN